MKIEPVSVKAVVEAHKNGTLKEVWGVGTAVVTSVFQALGYKGEKLELPKLPAEAVSYTHLDVYKRQVLLPSEVVLISLFISNFFKINLIF